MFAPKLALLAPPEGELSPLGRPGGTEGRIRVAPDAPPDGGAYGASGAALSAA